MSNVQSQAKEQKDNDEYSKNFARIPNMLFVSYKHLTKEEKFLYCTLKSVYWDAKPRYVSLREISEMTGYSTGALSKMIPRLHDCALLHAEIRRERDKRGKEYGNSKYNITILDIWELNRHYFSSSASERDALDPSLKLVHEMNEPVHQMNRLVHEKRQACSPNERVRARPKLTKDSRKTSLKTSLKEEEETATATTDKISFDVRKRMQKLLNPEEQLWFVEVWCEASFIEEPTLTVNLAGHIKTLARRITTVERLNNLHTYTGSQNFMQGKIIQPGNLVQYLNEFLLAEQKTSITIQPQETETEEELDKIVWWTRTPEEAFYGPLNENLHLLERMTIREAKKYQYGELQPFSAAEEAHITQLLASQELVAMKG